MNAKVSSAFVKEVEDTYFPSRRCVSTTLSYVVDMMSYSANSMMVTVTVRDASNSRLITKARQTQWRWTKSCC
jgi:hypothetical protein